MEIATIFLAVSASYHLPPNLLSNLCFVESRHKPDVVVTDTNGLRSVGLCQMQLRTARWLGFTGNERDLLNPKINARWAGAYLAYQFNRYGSWIKAVKAYNAGFAKTNKPNAYYKRVYSVGQ